MGRGEVVTAKEERDYLLGKLITINTLFERAETRIDQNEAQREIFRIIIELIKRSYDSEIQQEVTERIYWEDD